VAQLRMGRGSVRVQCGSVQGVPWLSRVWPGSVRVRRGSVQDGAWLSKGAVWLSSGNPENERMSVSDPWEKIEW
jgi:hypothetical protein